MILNHSLFTEGRELVEPPNDVGLVLMLAEALRSAP
mgnify:CR=1 FL=1